MIIIAGVIRVTPLGLLISSAVLVVTAANIGCLADVIVKVSAEIANLSQGVAILGVVTAYSKAI